MSPIAPQDVTGLVLAGGLGTRMGGAGAADLPAKSVSVVGAVLQILWPRLKRLFGRQ